MKLVIIAKGNTFPVKDQLKANGFRWCGGEARVWVCLPDQDDPTASYRILAGLRTLPGVEGDTADFDEYRAFFERGRGHKGSRRSPVVDARTPAERAEPRPGMETAAPKAESPFLGAIGEVGKPTTAEVKPILGKAMIAVRLMAAKGKLAEALREIERLEQALAESA